MRIGLYLAFYVSLCSHKLSNITDVFVIRHVNLMEFSTFGIFATITWRPGKDAQNLTLILTGVL
jgi:hypothetical protein